MRHLPLDLIYDGKNIISRSIIWSHDKGGIYCNQCAPGHHPDDPGEVVRDPRGKEKAIIEKLAEYPGGLDQAQLERETGISRTTSARRILSLLNDGIIERHDKKIFLKSDAKLTENDASDTI